MLSCAVFWQANAEQFACAVQVTKVKQQKKTLSNKEKKKKQRLRAAKIKAGEPVSSDSDEDY